jgi:hypothetical protein
MQRLSGSAVTTSVSTSPRAVAVLDAQVDSEDQADTDRPLDEWERYRALLDASNEAAAQISTTAGDTRFALMVMGAFTVFVLILLTRVDAFKALPVGGRSWMAGLFLVYFAVAVVFFISATEALRPGRFKPRLWDWTLGDDTRPAGIRYYEDVTRKSAAEHWQAWNEVRLAQVNAEICVQLHSLSRKNHARHQAVRALYLGIRLQAVVLALLVASYVWLWL